MNMRSSFFCAAAALALLACDADRIADPGREPDPPRGALVVRLGGSIQAAIDAAESGDVIEIEPGTYRESLTIDKPGLRIVGLRGSDGSGVVIENPGGARNGIAVRKGGDGFALVDVTVRGFDGNGVLLSRVRDFLLSGVVAEDNGEYGLYPIQSSRGVIENSFATGHADAGFYVGQSEQVTIRGSTARGNVVGVEISNSRRIELLSSQMSDNSAGVLVALLPGRTVRRTDLILVSGNRIRDNNLPNFADPGDLVAAVPAGSGILVVGADQTRVEGNTVTGNGFVGIGLGSSLVLRALAGQPPGRLPGIEPDPDSVWIRDNTVTGNGLGSGIPGFPAADLFWDGSGEGNCWLGNRFDSSAPAALPRCE